jgi:phosphatidylglycerol---prolipoprotein diacylglyceryl transferase
MLVHPEIDPVFIQVGFVKIHWYGVMYLVGFALSWYLLKYRAKKDKWRNWQAKHISDLIFYGAVGLVLGARIGWTLFYGFDKLIQDPLVMFAIWKGGMSFHGGAIGVVFAMWLYGKKINKTFFTMTDAVVSVAPLGLAFGRIGNFINGELYGRVTDLPIGMIFRNDPLKLPRHMSQLYECFLEGLVLFVILWFISKKPTTSGVVSAWFLILYGFFRFIVEFSRQPDEHLGFIAFGWMTMGQALSLPMILIGSVILWFALKNKLAPNKNAKLS